MAAAPIVPFISSVTEDGRVRGYSGPGDWLGKAPSLTPDETVDVEVVVVGAGHAGTQAVLSAMQSGAASAVVLEKQNADIFDWYGEDIAAYNCQLAKEHGLKEYDLGEIVNEYVTRSGGRDGSSIKMGCWAGGFIDPAPRGTMILGGGVSSPWGTNSCLQLNAKGKRYCNEGNIMAANRAAMRRCTRPIPWTPEEIERDVIRGRFLD